MPRALLAAVLATSASLPAPGTAQDTASAAARAWIGIRFNLEAHATPGPDQGLYALVVRDVYGNSPADLVGIRPGDWFVAVDGNPLVTYESWLRSTSNLGPGQTLSVRIFRGSGEQEVSVVADQRPRSLLPDPPYRLEWEVARARFDSLFDLFLQGGPGVAPWPGHRLPHIGWPDGIGVDPATLRVTIADSGIEVEGTIPAAPADVPQMSPRQGLQDGAEPATPLTRRTPLRPELQPDAGRAGTLTEQRRRADREAGRRAGPEGPAHRSEPTASPPDAGGGGTELDRTGGTAPGAISVLTPQLLGSTVTVVLGGAVVRDLPVELGRYFGVDTGVLVTDVIDAMTPAAQAGFRPGDIIVSVEGKDVENLLEFRRVLAEERPPIDITVIRRKNALKLAYPSG